MCSNEVSVKETATAQYIVAPLKTCISFRHVTGDIEHSIQRLGGFGGGDLWGMRMNESVQKFT